MVILSNQDMFDIKVSSLLADYDRETITNLYQPIIGYTALAVYFTFWREAKNQKIISLSSHEQLFMRMKIAPGDFIAARKVLEAVGLVKTRLEKTNGVSIYHYQLYAPKTPSKFFDDTLLYGLFIQNLGENEANRLRRVYLVNEVNEDGEDISSSFNDVFHPDFEDAAFYKASVKSTNIMGRNKSKIETEFSYEDFFKTLKSISQIGETSLTKKEMKEIERMATLYGIDASIVAEKVANSYNLDKEKGKRVDLKELNNELKLEVNYGFRNTKKKDSGGNMVVGEEGLASKIKLFESKSPREILSLLQNGTKPAQADLNIIYSLSKDYSLNNAVINVIIDFVLEMNNNVLSKYSVEKIASSISRENIVTAIDAMNYLQNNYTKKKSNRASPGRAKVSTKKEEAIEAPSISEEDQEEILNMFKDR